MKISLFVLFTFTGTLLIVVWAFYEPNTPDCIFCILWYSFCDNSMKKFLKILTSLFVLTGVGVFVMRKINTRRKLKQVAENGYETAQDVLFPDKEIRSKKLHYGPVLPGLK